MFKMLYIETNFSGSQKLKILVNAISWEVWEVSFGAYIIKVPEENEQCPFDLLMAQGIKLEEARRIHPII